MIDLTGSFVAMPTPFKKDDTSDFDGFSTLIDRQIKYGTTQIFVLGSAGETSLLTLAEKELIVREVIRMAKDRIPVFFNASAMTTEQSVDFARYCEAEGADGVIFTVPPYVLIPQAAALAHFEACMSAVEIPCGVYNNPSRVGVNINPETIQKLSAKFPHFVLDKEAVGSVEQLVQVQRLCEGKVKIMCCDYPKYSIVLPTLAVGGTGTANIGGNIIPEEVALYSRPWTDIEMVETAQREYFKWYPLLQQLYTFSNPIVIKAALEILGLPGGHLRKPYQSYGGKHREELEQMMGEMGVIDKYGVKR